jgi:hypothetical protein
MLGRHSCSVGHRMAKYVHAVLVCALVLTLNGCIVTRIGASERAHREQAELRTLIHPEDSFDSIYAVLIKRGYPCADQKSQEGYRTITCNKNMDSVVFGCSWKILVNIFETPALGRKLDIDAYQACI